MYYNVLQSFRTTFDCAASLDGIVTACITLQRAASSCQFSAFLLGGKHPLYILLFVAAVVPYSPQHSSLLHTSSDFAALFLAAVAASTVAFMLLQSQKRGQYPLPP